MKSFGTYTPPETVGLEFERLAVPCGKTLPRAPIAGEMFYLEVEMPGENMRPSYHRGLYMSTGFGWSPIGDQLSKKRSTVIGSQILEVEAAANITKAPTMKDGFHLASLVITPSNNRTTISGSASLWVSIDQSGYVVSSVFRGSKIVGIVVDFVEAGKPRTISLTFTDSPGSNSEQVYSVRITTTATGFLYVNQCKLFDYDGISQTAFLVQENN